MELTLGMSFVGNFVHCLAAPGWIAGKTILWLFISGKNPDFVLRMQQSASEDRSTAQPDLAAKISV
jgi:hypothetical protein